MDYSASHLPTALSTQERQQRGVARYLRRLHYLRESYGLWHSMINCALSFNDSRKVLVGTLELPANPPFRRSRIDPEIQLLINFRAAKLAAARGSNSGEPSACEMEQATAEIIENTQPQRGRPLNRVLKHHVHALMALYRQTCGQDLRAGITQNGAYDPIIKSGMQDIIVELFRRIDCSVTLGTLASIITKAHRANVLQGRRFEDFFPFFGGGLDPATDQPFPRPGFRFEAFDQGTRI